MTTIHQLNPMRLDARDMRELRRTRPELADQMMMWLIESGLDPNLLRSVTFGEGRVLAEFFCLNDEGQRHVDPDDPTVVHTYVAERPAPVPPPWFPGEVFR